MNFKSDYFPMEKLASPGMIAAIQGNSLPVDPKSRRRPAAPARAAAPAAAAPRDERARPRATHEHHARQHLPVRCGRPGASTRACCGPGAAARHGARRRRRGERPARAHWPTSATSTCLTAPRPPRTRRTWRSSRRCTWRTSWSRPGCCAPPNWSPGCSPAAPSRSRWARRRTDWPTSGRRGSERLSAAEREQLFAQVFEPQGFYPLMQALCDALADRSTTRRGPARRPRRAAGGG